MTVILEKARRTDTVNRSVGPPGEATSPYDPELDAADPGSLYAGPWAKRSEAGPG